MALPMPGICAQRALADRGVKVAGEGLQRARGVGVGAEFEDVLAFELEQLGDAFQRIGDLLFGDLRHVRGGERA